MSDILVFLAFLVVNEMAFTIILGQLWLHQNFRIISVSFDKDCMKFTNNFG